MLSAEPAELRARAEALREALNPLCPCGRGGDGGGGGGRRQPRRGLSPPGRWPCPRRRCWTTSSAGGRCPSWAVSTGANCCWTCAPSCPATGGRSPPPCGRGGGIRCDCLHRGPRGSRQDRPGEGADGGGYRPAGGGAPPGPHHRAGLRPPGAAGGGGGASVVDVPGHGQFVPTMLSGCSNMDGVLFTVAADEGPMPQTAEHLSILSLLGRSGGWWP